MTAASSAALLVVAVARLGEADLASWWRSHGLDAVGEYVLPDLFPRTAPVVGAELAVLSAAKRHADTLPDREVVHLFGEPLPAFAEAVAWLAELKTGGDASFVDELRGWATADDGHGFIAAITGEPPRGERIGATLRLGRIRADHLADAARTETIAKALAAAYVGQGRDVTIPYFDVV